MAADVQKRTEEKEIPDEIIVKLSSRCVLKPSLLARRLNLEETIFEQIEFAHPQDRYEQIYQILYKWRQSDPCPTLDKLSVAMDTGFAAVMEEYDQIDGIGHVTCKMNHVTGDKEGRVECDGPKPSKMRHIEQASDDNEDTDQSDDSEVPKLSDQSDDSCGPGTFDQSDEAIIPSAPPFHLLAAQSGDLPSSLPTIIRRTSTGQPLLVGPPVATSCPPLLPTNPLPPSASVSNMTVDDTALTYPDDYTAVLQAIRHETQWYELGLALKLLAPVLDEIKVSNRGNVCECREEMVKHWLKTEHPSWRVLVCGLRDDLVANGSLANRIARAHQVSRPY